MAGGKETPRQKMIGMMYLVLTALLAMNVSKEIINAFVTLDDKVAQGVNTSDQGINGLNIQFEAAKLDPAQKESAKEMEPTWKSVNSIADSAVDFLLRQAHEMLTTSDPEGNWLVENEEGLAIGINSLVEHRKKDDYDTPSLFFVGDDPASPNAEGWALAEKVHDVRDRMCRLIGNREDGGKTYSITLPESSDTSYEALSAAFGGAHADDKDYLMRLYRSLTIPETVTTKDAGEDVEQPWQVASFYHTPVVAANALIRAMVADVRKSHQQTLEHLYSRMDQPLLKINKITPQTVARSSYVNQNDPLPLTVTLAAFDSLETYTLAYAVDDDTLKPWEEWTKTDSGFIDLPTNSAKAHKVKGKMKIVTARGVKWEPFDYTYGVGAPQGVVSLIDMNILYKGYDNRVQGTASGYDPSQVTLKGDGVTLKKEKDYYIASPTRRGKVSISVVADGAKLGTLECQAKNLPNPQLYLNRKPSGTVPRAVVVNATKLTAGYGPDVPLNPERVKFTVKSWKVQVGSAAPRRGSGSDIGAASSLLRQVKSGMLVSVMAEVTGPDRVTRKIGGTYEVK